MRAITQDEMRYAELVYEMELEACQPSPYFKSPRPEKKAEEKTDASGS